MVEGTEMVEGEIQVGGVNINRLDLEWWRSQIGLVQQEPVLFNTTVLENISMGLTGTKWENSSDHDKMEMVVSASKEAFADDFIKKLPQVWHYEKITKFSLCAAKPLMNSTGVFNLGWRRRDGSQRGSTTAHSDCALYRPATSHRDS
jgi:ABC-type multidrug transport system fused ATPase/permease subunit